MYTFIHYGLYSKFCNFIYDSNILTKIIEILMRITIKENLNVKNTTHYI